MTVPNAADAPPMILDPFAFWPESISKISGLGGAEFSSDPDYVFHSQYTELTSGRIECNVWFGGLSAQYGSLTLRINALPSEPGAHAQHVVSQVVELHELAVSGAAVVMTFHAEPGLAYAVLGHISGHTDASAHALAATFTILRRSNVLEDKLVEARTSIFGRRIFHRAAKMMARGPATLADPVSQACTNSQFHEPDYQAWLDRLHVPLAKHRKQWEFIYILRSLEHFGMLRPGARGLGFGVGIEPLPAAMAAAGCTVVASDLQSDDERAKDWRLTDQHSNTVEQLRQPLICPNDVFDAHVSFRSVDMNAIDADLQGFDFTWSSCALEHLGSIEAGLAFIRNSVACLKPGGLAVHTTEMNLTSDRKTIDKQSTVLFRRRDFERVALDLALQGHFVAPLNYDLGDTPLDAYIDMPPYSSDSHLKLALGQFVTTSFGIIVRRGDR